VSHEGLNGEMAQPIPDSSNQSRARERQDPGNNDFLAPDPSNGMPASSRANARNGTTDGMRGRNRNGGQGCQPNGSGGREFGREPANWTKVRSDARAHGLDDAPAAQERSNGHGGVTAEDDPHGQFVLGTQKVEMADGPFLFSTGDQQSGNDAHGFLRVVGAVPKAVRARGNQLQAGESFFGGSLRLRCSFRKSTPEYLRDPEE
jgi:hypothetical protein